MREPFRFVLRLPIACIVLTAIVTSPRVFAADFKVGDKVSFDRAGQQVTGEIIERDNPVICRVEVSTNGRKRRMSVPLTELTLLASSDDEGPEREWSDKSGKYKMIGRLVEKTKAHVSLQKSDGTVKKVPIAKLSDADQKYLAEMGSAARVSRPDASAGSVARARSIELRPEPWSYEPTRASEPRTALKPIRIPAAANLSIAIASQDRTKVVLTSHVGHGSPEQIPVVDLATGKTISFEMLSRSESPDRMGVGSMGASEKQVWDLHQDGQHIAVGPGLASFGGVVSVVSVDGTEVFRWQQGTSEAAIQPFGTSLVRFVDDDFLLVMDSSQLVVWDWKSKEAVYKTRRGESMASMMRGALSMDRHTLLAHASGLEFGSSNMLFLLDTLTGKVRGSMPIPNGRQPNHYAFNSDGTKLAAAFPGKVYVWDLEDKGKMQQTSVFNKNSRFAGMESQVGGLGWAGEFVLYNGVLIDPTIGATVWRYQVPENESYLYLSQLGGDQFLSVSGKDGTAHLNQVTIPHEGLSAKIAAINTNGLVSLKRGKAVKLVTDLDEMLGSEREKVLAAIHSRLEKAGILVDEQSPFVITLSATPAPARDVVLKGYLGSDRKRYINRGKDEDFTFRATPTVHTLRLDVNDKTLFTRQETPVPDSNRLIQVNPGESVQEAVDRSCEPNSRFFLRTEIPTEFTLLPGNKLELGYSTISADGIR